MSNLEIIPVRFELRYGTTAQWETANPLLREGEPGIEVLVSGQRSMKIGDGILLWNDLPYFIDTGGVAGPPGPEGDSAYEVAVNNGFVGTEAQWLDSLEGDQGPQGIQGIQGNQGIQGIQGPPGDTGPQGIQGIQGIQGPPGEDGEVPTNAMLAFKWNGSAYVASVNAGHYVGPNDPGSVPDGSIWDQTP